MLNSVWLLSFLPLSVYAPFRFGKYSILPNSLLPLSVYAPFRLCPFPVLNKLNYASFLYALFLYAIFRFGTKLIMPLSFMPLSVSAPFRFCPVPFMPLSGLMENADYAGFLYANFRASASKHDSFTFLYFFFFPPPPAAANCANANAFAALSSSIAMAMYAPAMASNVPIAIIIGFMMASCRACGVIIDEDGAGGAVVG
jgi:hypothetical protein